MVCFITPVAQKKCRTINRTNSKIAAKKWRASVLEFRKIISEEIIKLNESLDKQFTDVKTSLKNIGDRMTKNEEGISYLESRITKVENNISTLPTGNNIIDTQNQIFFEIDDRQRRASNAIVFNLSDNITNDKNTDKLNDSSAISNILNPLNMTFEDSCLTFFRIGKPIPNSTVARPLKIIFKSQEKAKLFKEQFWRLKSNQPIPLSLQAINVADDRTPLQLQQLQSLKKELAQKEASERELWKIKFPGGIPRLVKISKKQ